MKKLDRRRFWIAFTVSTLVFFCFAAPAIYFALRTQEAKTGAQSYYDELVAHATDCSGQAGRDACSALAKTRLNFDKAVERVDDLRNVTKIFMLFAVFVPLIIWAAYFLTRAVFHSEHSH